MSEQRTSKRKLARTAVAVVVLALLAALLIGIPVGRQFEKLGAARYRPTMSWVAQDGTVLVCRDLAKTGLEPDWETLYSVLPKDVRGKTIEIQLLQRVQGAVDGRLVRKIETGRIVSEDGQVTPETATGWLLQVQLGDIPKQNRQAFANAAVVYSAALMEGKPREMAIKQVMEMAFAPASFR